MFFKSKKTRNSRYYREFYCKLTIYTWGKKNADRVGISQYELVNEYIVRNRNNEKDKPYLYYCHNRTLDSIKLQGTKEETTEKRER